MKLYLSNQLTARQTPSRQERGSVSSRPGYVLVAVLIVIVVLALVAYRFTESMTAEYRAGVRTTDDAQAKFAAVSGLHYAAAVLSDRNTFYGELGGNPYDNTDIFLDVMVPTTGGRKEARFSIISVAVVGLGSYEQRYGVIDEASKININSLLAMDKTGQLLFDVLMKLPLMTEDIADAIVDWIDADDDSRPSGAESSYYLSLSSPYRAKNGPLNSLDELLLIKGITPQVLHGDDRNRNGVQDEGELSADRGWADFLTVYGRELNVAASGTVRIYLNGDDLNALYQQLLTAVDADMAAYIVASKMFSTTRVDANGNPVSSGKSGGGKSQRPVRTATTDELLAAVKTKMESTGSSGTRIRSVIDMTSTRITLPRPRDAKQDDPDIVAYSPMLDPTRRTDLLPKLMDRTTVRQAIEMVPRINVNTAPREVLMAIPGMTDADADAIISLRTGLTPGDPATNSAAWLMTVHTMTGDTFKKLEKYITGSTMVYRVQSIGYLANGGPVARMEAVIDTNQGAPRFLHIRDLSDLDNPRAFEPPRVTPQ